MLLGLCHMFLWVQAGLRDKELESVATQVRVLLDSYCGRPLGPVLPPPCSGIWANQVSVPVGFDIVFELGYEVSVTVGKTTLL